MLQYESYCHPAKPKINFWKGDQKQIASEMGVAQHYELLWNG